MSAEVVEKAVEYKEVCEGAAKALFPDTGEVFYNPVQEFNRDVSVAVIKAFSEIYEPHTYIHGRWKKPVSTTAANSTTASESTASTAESRREDDSDRASKPFRVLEALSATGLRSVRYAKEIPRATEIVANDFSQAAAALIQRNIEHNSCADKVTSSLSDASLLMQSSVRPGGFFDVVDLDPYGAPTQFLDGAVKCVAEGGLLCVTCTDLGVLCGNHGDACYGKYGSVALRAPYCHEMALRILLSSISSHAARYHRYIVPLVCLSVDFYIRVFVRVFTSQAEVKRTTTKLASVYNCTGCSNFRLQPLARRVETSGGNFKILPGMAAMPAECPECASKLHVGGPVWTPAMHDKEFVDRVVVDVTARREAFGTADRIAGMLTVVAEDLLDVPFYYQVSQLCHQLHCSAPKTLAIRSALMRLGYRVAYVHCNKDGLRTDAPIGVLYDVFRTWVKQNPGKKLSATAPGAKILARQPTADVCFDILPEANPPSRRNNLLRHQVNPEPNWGPKCRAKKRKGDGEVESEPEKRKRLQDKRSNRPAPNLKMYPCKRFREGACPLTEENCRYRHEVDGENVENVEAAAE